MSLILTAWKVSKYGAFSGPYFFVFECLVLKMQNFQDSIFIWAQTYGEIFKSALMHLKLASEAALQICS